jgi:predicted nucleic acid-binding protein
MRFLLDSGILLRLVDEHDLQHDLVETAIGTLGNRGEELYITTQNIAEFWNVATRPVANNGLGLPPAAVAKSFDVTIEPSCAVLAELGTLHVEFRRLLTKYSVVGKQVHDARLVAMMLIWQIDTILTLNERNFLRYLPEGIAVISPASLISPSP